jgi:hypothetical protein
LFRKEGDLTGGRSYFERCQKAADQQGLKQLSLSCTYEIGWCFYLDEQWKETIEWLTKYMSTVKSPGAAAFASYQLAVAHFFFGSDFNLIVKSLEGVSPWVRKHFSWDVFADRRAREYLRALKGATKPADMMSSAVSCELRSFWTISFAP